MGKSLEDIVKGSRATLEKKKISEDDIREEFVTHLLDWLGYLPAEKDRGRKLKTPYYKSGTKRKEYIVPDYIISLENKTAFVIDAKKPEIDIRDNEYIQQVHSYAAHREIQADFFLLTNASETVAYRTNDTIFEPIFSFPLEELLEKKEELRKRLSKDSVIETLKINQMGEELSAGGMQIFLGGLPYSTDKKVKERIGKALQYRKEENHAAAIGELQDTLIGSDLALTERIAALINLGNSYYSLSQYDKALNRYNAVLRLSEKMKGKKGLKGEAAALGNIGIINLRRNLKEALEYSKKSLEINEKNGNKEGQAGNLANIGLIYEDMGDSGRSLKYHQASLEILKEINDQHCEAINLGNIGNIFRNKRKLDKALEYFNCALEIYKKIGHKSGEADQWGNIGVVYYNEGDFEGALEHWNKALEIKRKINDRLGEATSLGNIGSAYRTKNKLNKALKYYRKAFKINKEIGNRRGEAFNLGNIGSTYLEMDDKLETAFECFNCALETYKKIGDKKGEADMLGKIGSIYQGENNLETALEYHKGSLQIHRMTGYSQGEAEQLNNIGVIHTAKKDYDNALECMNGSLEIEKKIGNKLGEAIVLGDIGIFYGKMNDSEEALNHLKETLGIYREIDDSQRESNALGNIGYVYYVKKDYKNAIEYTVKAKSIFKNLQSPYLQQAENFLSSIKLNIGSIQFNHYLKQITNNKK